jgi:hypothetical protein
MDQNARAGSIENAPGLVTTEMLIDQMLFHLELARLLSNDFSLEGDRAFHMHLKVAEARKQQAMFLENLETRGHQSNEK